MIRIRFLTSGSLATLLVKTAEEQMASRLACKQPYEAFPHRGKLLVPKGQEKGPYR
jgi:hypothetical protein